MLGAGVALLTSLAWSISSICVKLVAGKVDSLTINTLRTGVGSILLVLFIISSGRMEVLFSTPWPSLVFVVLSGLLAMVLGDTIYIKSVSLLDVSLAFPLSQCSFILLAVLAAVWFLGEPFTWITFLGAVLIILGILLMTASRGRVGNLENKKRIHPMGLLYILIAILAWTGATILLKVGVIGVDPFIAAGVRISTSALVLLTLYIPQQGKSVSSFRSIGKKHLILTAAAGFLTYGVAAVGYITALQWIGAGRTVLLTAIAPIFALPFAVAILKEKPTRFSVLGVIVSILGVWLVTV
jgi:drug/metabolite transporter (DMT)-like permease